VRFSVGATNQLVFFLGLIAASAGALIKVSKMRGTLLIGDSTMLVIEFYAAEKLH